MKPHTTTTPASSALPSAKDWPEHYRKWFHGSRDDTPPSKNGLSPFCLKQAELLEGIGKAILKSPDASEAASKDLKAAEGADGHSLAGLRTIERWLRHQPSALRGKPTNICAPVDVLPSRKAAVSLLLSNTTANVGLSAFLWLELFQRTDATGALFAHREMLFTECDEAWQTALEHAAAGFPDLWKEYDVRWRVVPQATEKWLAALSGNSAGGAFQYALHCLATGEQPVPGVAISTAVGKDGQSWETVGALLEKLIAAARKARPAIHTVVLSAKEDLDGIVAGLERQRQANVPFWLDNSPAEGGQFGRPAIIQAANFSEGIQRAVLPAQRRWSLFHQSHILEPLPMLWEVRRDKFITEITKRVEAMEKGFLLITGEMGRGKTVAMGQLIRQWREDGRAPVCYFSPKEGVNPCKPDEIARHLLLQLLLKYNFEEPADWATYFPNDYAGRLEDMLRTLSRRLGTRQKEVIVVEAADQAVLEGKGDIIPSVLRSPPPGVVWLVSSRPRTAPAISGEACVETLDFQSLVDDRADVRSLLERRGAALTPPLAANLFDAICNGPIPPVMFSIDWAFRQLEAAGRTPVPEPILQSLRGEALHWLREPRLLVYQDLHWVLEAAEKRGVSKRDARRWLLLPALASGMSRDLLKGLGIFPEAAKTVFALAANLFQEPHVYSLRHPGYARAIRGEEIPNEGELSAAGMGRAVADDAELPDAAIVPDAHWLIGEACLKKWADQMTPPAVAAYALRSVCTHLRGAGRDREWFDLLSSQPEFLFRRGETGGMDALADDFPQYGEAEDASLGPAEVDFINAVREIVRERGHFVEGRDPGPDATAASNPNPKAAP